MKLNPHGTYWPWYPSTLSLCKAKHGRCFALIIHAWKEKRKQTSIYPLFVVHYCGFDFNYSDTKHLGFHDNDKKNLKYSQPRRKPHPSVVLALGPGLRLDLPIDWIRCVALPSAGTWKTCEIILSWQMQNFCLHWLPPPMCSWHLEKALGHTQHYHNFSDWGSPRTSDEVPALNSNRKGCILN